MKSIKCVLLCVLILLAGLLAVACTLPAVAQLDLIVTAAETLIPYIPRLPAAEAPKVTAYADGALKIADDLLGQEITTSTLANAVGDFNTLEANQPFVSDTKTQNFIAALGKAVHAFLVNYNGTTVQIANYPSSPYARALLPAKKSIRISDKDKARLQAIHSRVKAARERLRQS